jgi:hypothetical protein
MTIIVITLLICIIAALAFGCYNLIKQNESLEEATLFYQSKLEEIREKVLQTEVELKELDIRGAFEADDEVGFVFQNIKELSSELTKTVQSTYEYRD